MKPIGYIETDFKEKFGIPRQSGLVKGAQGILHFYPPYHQIEAFRGLEEYSHIWILWEFHKAKSDNWNATVRPPRLGGKERIGVFATRSPFRPNSIGLSCVKLEELCPVDGAMTIRVSGVDLLDGTPILDIKPYLPYADAFPDAEAGFTTRTDTKLYDVLFLEHLEKQFPQKTLQLIADVLAQDPRPGVQKDVKESYSMRFQNYDLHFKYEDEKIVVTEISNS